jgi:hypothetical protein
LPSAGEKSVQLVWSSSAVVKSTRPKALSAPTAQAVARVLLEGAANLFGDRSKPAGCLGVPGALDCGEEADPIRRERIANRTVGKQAIRQRLDAL